MKLATLGLLALWLSPLAVWAEQPAAARAAQPEASASAASAPASALPARPGSDAAGREPIEPNVQHIVVEGKNTRVEELRVRGQTQSIVVKNKDAPAYEIVIGDGSRDVSGDAGAQKGAAGQRVWRLLTF
ncbi:MAG TPA: hypothetical protein PLG77_12285 [Burkholderiaceae bacterium]|nr:hypothetical protein [Burkholderiaceae bacterium]